jgi:hypothetical protein
MTPQAIFGISVLLSFIVWATIAMPCLATYAASV